MNKLFKIHLESPSCAKPIQLDFTSWTFEKYFIQVFGFLKFSHTRTTKRLNSLPEIVLRSTFCELFSVCSVALTVPLVESSAIKALALVNFSAPHNVALWFFLLWFFLSCLFCDMKQARKIGGLFSNMIETSFPIPILDRQKFYEIKLILIFLLFTSTPPSII